VRTNARLVAAATESGTIPAVSGERLDSWKEIAAYLKRDVATVRRWEKREALPVHRHLHEKLGSVYAFTSELDAWQEARRQQVDRQPRRAFGSTRTAWITLAVGVFVTVVGASYLVRESGRERGGPARLRLAVHRPGTVASLVVAGLQDVLQRAMPATAVELVEQPGMTSTLRAIDQGVVDLGLAFNLLAFHAAKTEQLLGKPSREITALAVAYLTPAQIVVRRDSDIATVGDLKGKRVSLGIAESGERFSSEILLAHLGIGAADLSPHFIDFAPSLDDLRARRIDAYVTWRGVPVPDLSDAFASGEFRLVPVEAESLQGLRLKHPFLLPWTIPARVYANQTSPVPTVSARMVLVGSRSLSPDVVEQILRAIDAHLPDLVARHPAAAQINVKTRPILEDGLSIDLHPGAERFFGSI
jgi:TRAP transporter TAXI family solute receptor